MEKPFIYSAICENRHILTPFVADGENSVTFGKYVTIVFIVLLSFYIFNDSMNLSEFANLNVIIKIYVVN